MEEKRTISDNEIRPFFDRSKQKIDIDEQKVRLQQQIIFDQELESAILTSPKGTELKKLVEMGYINLQEDILSKYIGEKGREYKNGTIVIDRDVLNKIHLECLISVSERLGSDRTLNIKDIEQIASKEDHVERTNYIEKEVNSNTQKNVNEKNTTNQILNTDNKINNENINNVCRGLNILGKEYLDTKNIKEMLNGLGLNSNIDKYENKTVDTFMTLQDSNILEFLAQASILKNSGKQEELDKLIKDSEFGLGVNVDSKFYKQIIGKDGKIDIEKGLKFWNGYKVDREYAVLNNDIFKYMSGSNKNERRLAVLLLRGTEIDDKDTQEKLKSLAKGIDVIDEYGNIDKEKLFSYVEREFDLGSAEELLKRHIFTNDETALKIIRRIKEKEIDRMQQGRIENLGELKDADDVQKYRKSEASRTKRICSKKEQIVYNVLNSLNAGNTANMKNFFETPDNAKQVVLLFCQFRKKELGREITADDVNTYEDSDTSAIIAKYMMEHTEYFGDYFQKIGVLKSEMISNSKDISLSAGQATRVLNMYDTINLDIKSIENTERRYSKSIDKINNFLEQENNNQENIDEIYNLVKKMPITAFSTEMLENLKKQDEKRFSEAFKNKTTERTVGKDTFGAVCYSAARLFSKGLYTLPRMFIDKETRQEYMPKIRNHIKSGTKRLINVLTTNKDNKKNLLGKFVNSFKKDKREKLPPAKEAENNSRKDKRENSQQNYMQDASLNFNATIKVVNNDGQIEAGARASNNSKESPNSIGQNTSKAEAVIMGEEGR